MLGDSIKYVEKVEESRQVERIKNFMLNQAIEFIPSYYAVCYYCRAFDGSFLSPAEYRKRWDRKEVEITHAVISSLIKKCFGEVPLFWFSNRHKDFEDINGICKKGSFHSDLYIGHIEDKAIEQPSKFLSTLIFNAKQSGESINIDKIGIDSAKKLLLERCIRKAKWVGNHKNSLRVDPVPIEEFSQTFVYGLKDITKLDDFNQVVDWQNSSFYQATNQSSSVIS